MFGKNKILKPEIHAGENLDVQKIFPTLQGEGPYVGQPSVFVRLGGCNLACEFCDTEFESYKNFSLEEILKTVEKFSQDSQKKRVRNLVVITGGEPLRQPIERLCEELVKLKFLVQIETNGTIFRKLPKEIKIICSPKITNGKYHQIRPDLLVRVDAFKFIISKNQKEYRDIGQVGQEKSGALIYVQPMDEYDEAKNKANLQHCVKLCEKHGYFLSLQTHKLLGIE
jgi:organic radical activating enzyme